MGTQQQKHEAFVMVAAFFGAVGCVVAGLGVAAVLFFGNVFLGFGLPFTGPTFARCDVGGVDVEVVCFRDDPVLQRASEHEQARCHDACIDAHNAR